MENKPSWRVLLDPLTELLGTLIGALQSQTRSEARGPSHQFQRRLQVCGVRDCFSQEESFLHALMRDKEEGRDFKVLFALD